MGSSPSPLGVIVIILGLVPALLYAAWRSTGGKSSGEDDGGIVSKPLALVTLVGGLVLYGWGYFTLPADNPSAGPVSSTFNVAFRTVCDTLCMFLGNNDFDAVQDSAAMQFPFVEPLFWLAHILAVFVTASAVMSVILSQTMRQRAQRRTRNHHDDRVIFGTGEDALALGRELLAEEACCVTFVGEGFDASAAEDLERMGATVLDGTLFDANGSLVPKAMPVAKAAHVDARSDTCRVYALGDDEAANLSFARTMRDQLEEAGLRPERTRLAILCPEDQAAGLEAHQDKGKEAHYGFGNVTTMEAPQMAARTLVDQCPPFQVMSFEDCRAVGAGGWGPSFHCMVIGFGRTGQEVLSQLYQNGQFAGSSFHADIVDPDCSLLWEGFVDRRPAVKGSNAFACHDLDGRSGQVLALLDADPEIRYVAVCTNDSQLNAELARGIYEHAADVRTSARPLDLCTCSADDLRRIQAPRGKGADGAPNGVVACLSARPRVLSPKVLDDEWLDFMAMCVNYNYELQHPDPSDPEKPGPQGMLKKWHPLDHFYRESNRASARYIRTQLAVAGMDPDALEPDRWEETAKRFEEVLDASPDAVDTLGRAEHQRWVAFYEMSGWLPLTGDDLTEVRERFADLKAKKPQRDDARRLQACMIPYDDLDALSEGTNVAIREHNQRVEPEDQVDEMDFRKSDKTNVTSIPDVLRNAAKLRRDRMGQA